MLREESFPNRSGHAETSPERLGLELARGCTLDSVEQKLSEHARSSGLLSVKLAVREIIRQRDAEAAERLFRELRRQTGGPAREFDVRAGASEPQGFRLGVYGAEVRTTIWTQETTE